MSDPTGGSENPEHQGDPGPPDVGSLGEEAAKLLGAVSEWARDQGSDTGDGLSQGLSQGFGSIVGSLAGINDHLATGAPECTYCPVCRTVHVVRQTSPEVRAHLATAASSFLQAMAELVSTLPQARSGQSGQTGSEFERIDLDDEEDGDQP